MSVFPNQQVTLARAREAIGAGRHGEARELCLQALRRNKRDLDALELLGIIELDLGVFDAALRHFESCAKLRPEEIKFEYLIGRVQSDQGRAKDAIARFERCLRRDPRSLLYAQSMAVVLERIGEHERARSLLRPFIDEGRATAAMAALFGRLEIHRGRPADAIAFVTARLGDAALALSERQGLLYVLGKAYEKAGDFDRQFAACREANEIAPAPFDPEAYRAAIDELIEVFSAKQLPAIERSRRRDELPVFIAGMPRSGTTLVERIIDAHPAGYGAGELIDLTRLVDRFQVETDAFEPYPACVRELASSECDRLSRAYLDRLRSLSRRARRIVNKALDNVLHVGLISRLWPGARVIYTRRDPRDTCISCYLNPMLPDRCPYVTDLRHLGFALRQQERLVQHWREVIDLPALDVVYEELIDDQEGGSRRIVDFLGLDWDDRCLRYYESDRAVMTLSYDQVSRPIYRSAVGRWRNYERHLGPLLEGLEA
jgi:tetratricopeptide (TPR) repeat protein